MQEGEMLRFLAISTIISRNDESGDFEHEAPGRLSRTRD
jgi:hypothetical protein